MRLPLRRRDLLISGVAFGAAGSLPAARGEAAPAPTTLTAGRRSLDVNGKAASVFALTQPDGTSGLTASVKDPFRVHLVNDAGVETLIHWHGLTPPYQQDGVPGLSGPPIGAGATAAYDFPLRQAGTYWMHSHVGFQEQQLMTAPLIIHAAAAPTERELVVMLHDFSFTTPDEIFARLRGRSGANASSGVRQTGGMQMQTGAAPDLNDVSYDAFLADDRTLADPSVVRVDPGERLRLRIINGASASNFHLRLGGLKARVMAVDGQPVQPMTVS
ncbi:MAG TPA: multicopper oxidase domain-containing protein, partial [Acetobacteraceae bacterium]